MLCAHESGFRKTYNASRLDNGRASPRPHLNDASSSVEIFVGILKMVLNGRRQEDLKDGVNKVRSANLSGLDVFKSARNYNSITLNDC